MVVTSIVAAVRFVCLRLSSSPFSTCLFSLARYFCQILPLLQNQVLEDRVLNAETTMSLIKVYEMAASIFFSMSFSHCSSRRRGLFFLSISLAFTTSVIMFLYVYYTSKLYIHRPEFSKINPQAAVGFGKPQQINNQISQEVDSIESNDVFHDRALFFEEYKEMNKSLKIYAYPHKKDDPFANVMLPVDTEPGGNYASESYFKKSLFKSHFLTNDPSEADIFYLPFSIASLRHDKRVGVGGIKDFIRNYVHNISRSYPFWNRTGGADHFYVACHSVGRTAMEKAVEVKLNAVQVVCSSSYFVPSYVSHKDASIPQIWPRKGKPPTRLPSQRKKLAFYAGAMNSNVRQFLVKIWGNDPKISVHRSRLQTSYSEALLESKFCIHAKGFEVNTARIGDALYYGCVPVVLSNYYDLPYADILKWNSFSVIVSTWDIPLLKKILEEIREDEYLELQRNVMRVQKHFQWHNLPIDYDAFHMVMYELWLRRSHVRISVDSLSD